MVNRKILLGVAVIAMLTLSAGVAWADEVTSVINYQGRLADSSGSPLTGTYEMTFRLYEDATGGTALDTDTHSVAVENGLFNTEIYFGQSYFDGRALWLGITVGTDSEMTPRQELRPVPYALSLVPGAVIDGSRSGPVLKVNTDGDDSYGVYAYTTGEDSEGFYAYTTGVDSEGFYAETFGDYSEGVNARTYGDGSEGVYAKTTGKDSPAVYGWSEQDVGVYGKGKGGGYFDASGGDGRGVYGEAAGSSGKGVYGKASNTGDVRNYGGFFVADGIRGRGIYGKASNTGDAINYGGFFYASGTEGRGVFGQAAGSSGYGVKGWASDDGDVKNYGGHFCAAGSEGIGVYGWAENTGDGEKYGGYFVAEGDGGTGVYGRGSEGGYFTTTMAGTGANGAENLLAGVNVSTAYDHNPGVRIETIGHESDGVHARTYGGRSDGVRAITTGDKSYGVHAYSDKSYAIYADTGRSDNVFGVYTPDKMCAMSYDSLCSDVAEYFAVDEDPEPGTVMVIGEDGKLRCSTTAYDTTVAGIVSTSPGVSLGTKEDGNDGEELIAVAGRVPCRVDASYAKVMPGDLLTTSDTPGYAMKATNPQIGTILGKALEPLDSGKDVIEVLVTLQ